MDLVKKLDFDTLVFGDNPIWAIVALHGWKGNKDSMKQAAKAMKLDHSLWFFPEAPYMVDDDSNQRSWSYEKSPGIWERTEPKQLLDKFFTDKVFTSFISTDVFVVGFSQGALMCYEYALQMDKPLGGVFPIAGFITEPEKNKKRLHPNQIDTPILIGHGKDDDIVPFSSSEMAYKQFNEESRNIQLFPYIGKHKIGLEYIKAMKKVITISK